MTGLAEQRERITGTLYAAVLSDVMDGLGLMDQAMRPFVRPLDEAWSCSAAPAPGSTCRAIRSSRARTPTRSRSR